MNYADPFTKLKMFHFQVRPESISEEKLEQSILEAIDYLRKKNRCSSDVTIAKYVIAQNPKVTFDMVLDQMSKCITYGLIEKVNNIDRFSYRLNFFC